MARKPRIQYSGAFYHIIVRGNQRQNIFLEDADWIRCINESLTPLWPVLKTRLLHIEEVLAERNYYHRLHAEFLGENE